MERNFNFSNDQILSPEGILYDDYPESPKYVEGVFDINEPIYADGSNPDISNFIFQSPTGQSYSLNELFEMKKMIDERIQAEQDLEDQNNFYKKFVYDDIQRHLENGYYIVRARFPCMLSAVSISKEDVVEFYDIKRVYYASINGTPDPRKWRNFPSLDVYITETQGALYNLINELIIRPPTKSCLDGRVRNDTFPWDKINKNFNVWFNNQLIIASGIPTTTSLSPKIIY